MSERQHQSLVGGDRLVRHIRPQNAEGDRGRQIRRGLDGRLSKGTLRSKKRELELALEGTFTDQQRWLLDKELRQVEWLETQVQVLEREIERRVAEFEEPMGRLLTVPGIDRKTAWTIVAEIGVDLSAFQDARHLASWAGLCPGNNESGGKRMSGRTRKANRYVKRAMCQAAWAASHTKNTYLSAFYRRMCVRKGAPKAVIALAHHMLVVVYNLLARGEQYVELGGDYYDRQNKPKVVARLVKRLMTLGYYVDIKLVEENSREQTPDIDLPPSSVAQISASGDVSEVPNSTEITAKRRRGRPCKCAEKDIICTHGTVERLNSLIQNESSPGRFS